MIKQLKIGLLGHGFMGKAHTNAFKKINYIFYPFPIEPELEIICGRNEESVKEAAERYRYKSWSTDWNDIIDNQEIDIFDNTGTNNIHYEPCMAALRAKKHVIVEKPMALNLEEAQTMYRTAHEAEKNGIKHLVAFNYRFVPALRLARRIIEEGRLGKIYQFRSNFLMDRMSDPDIPIAWRLEKNKAGSGTLGDLNSHAIDILRFLLQSEVAAVMACNNTFNGWRPDADGKMREVGVEDLSMLWLKLKNGAVASLEASKVATGYKSKWRIEIHGSEGGIVFDLSRGNELQFYDRTDPLYIQGMRTINVTEPEAHDYIKDWWPRGHGLGWEHYHINMIEHFLRSVATGSSVAPWGATFYDGLRCQEVIDAAHRSIENSCWINMKCETEDN